MRWRRALAIFALAPACPALAAAPAEVVHLENLSARDVLVLAGQLIDAGRFDDAEVLLSRLERDRTGGVEREFLAGMMALARKDLPRAEAVFRQILARNPGLLRVRLELARTLFLARKDEEADYHFRLAIAARPDARVIAAIRRLREAIRARRAWRVTVSLGIAPDSNINSATRAERVEILGLPFELAPQSRARSGTGIIAGAEASVRLWREARVPLYLAAYGRVQRYPDHDFDDIYIGAEVGPEFRLGTGRLRVSATGFYRWYGGRPLVSSLGARLNYDKVLGGKLGLEASLALRRNDYARRSDVDGWDIEADLSLNRALSPSAAGFAWVSLQRSAMHDPGSSSWSGRIGAGVLKEIGWGLRPQLSLELGAQANDAPSILFGKARRDRRIQVSAGIYKRDWNVAGFAPSLRVTWSRNFSNIPLYDQRRLRAEIGISRAF